MTPQVSVIISAYQKADLLPRTLNSVLAQTLTDFEVIVVDDGSTDNTREVVNQFVEKDSRVRYIYQENQGPSGARNTGIQNAKADLIALLDGDDTWDAHKLEYQTLIMKKYQFIDLLFTNSLFINDLDSQNIIKKNSYYHDYIMSEYNLEILEEEPSLYLLSSENLPQKLLQKNMIHLSTAIFHRHVFDQLDGFILSLRGTEDIDFWVRAALKHYRFAYSSSRNATYFKNPTSLIQTSNERTQLEQLKYALYAFQSVEYQSVRDATKARLQKQFRQLIAYYGSIRKPLKAIDAFKQSLICGPDVKAMLLAFISFGGPMFVILYAKLGKFVRRLRKSGNYA